MGLGLWRRDVDDDGDCGDERVSGGLSWRWSVGWVAFGEKQFLKYLNVHREKEKENGHSRAMFIIYVVVVIILPCMRLLSLSAQVVRSTWVFHVCDAVCTLLVIAPFTHAHFLSVYIHRLCRGGGSVILELVHRDVLVDLLLCDDLLVEHSRCPALEPVVALLGLSGVGRPVVPHQCRLFLCDDGDIDVASGTQVVPDTRLDGVGTQQDGLVARQAWLPLRLEDGHGGQRTRAHGHVGQLVGGAVGVDGEEMGACRVDAGNDKVGANVALVAEEVLLEHGHARDDAWFAACGEGVQLEVGRDDGRGEFCVCSGTGAGTPDLGRNVVQLLAVLCRASVVRDRERVCVCVCF